MATLCEFQILAERYDERKRRTNSSSFRRAGQPESCEDIINLRPLSCSPATTAPLRLLSDSAPNRPRQTPPARYLRFSVSTIWPSQLGEDVNGKETALTEAVDETAPSGRPKEQNSDAVKTSKNWVDSEAADLPTIHP